MLPKVEIKKRSSIEKYKISNFIHMSMQNLTIKPLKVEDKIKIIYETAVGKEIAQVSSIIKYQNKELTVKVKNAAWKNDLSFREEEIKNSINSNKNKYLVVNKIIFK
jgi:hypothetical protein